MVFNTIYDREKYYKLFPNTWYRNIIYIFKNLFSCCCKAKARGKTLKWMDSFKVEKAPEPEDVYWENFIYTEKNRIFRKSVTIGITLLLTVLNFGIILALNYADVK